jgi:hypothetical protein
MKDLYDTTKTRAGNFRQTSQQIKDKNGKVLTTAEEQLARWASGFAFRASGGLLYGPAALAVFNFLIACLISVFDGRLRFIFSSSSALLISGVT